MAAYFLCLTAGGGIPLFCKTRKGLQQLPFPVAGSLNGVHMFANTHGVKLQSTTTTDSKIIWKTYHDSLTLILVAQDDGGSDLHVERLLDYMFHAMVLLYGLDNLTNIKNLERFKREIKVCNQLIDHILDLLDTPSVCEITHCVDLVTGPECLILQNYLDTFCEAASSGYGCLLVGGRVAVATRKWWELAAVELVLLRMLSASLPSCTSRDVPVFLPVTSPEVPHRLLTFHLISGVEVCVLCGPTPTLAELEREVERFWRSSVDSLRSIKQNSARLLPHDVTLDPNIQSLLVLNTETHRCLCTTSPHTNHDSTNTSPIHQQSNANRKRLKTLHAFYKSICGSLWPPAAMETQTESEKALTSRDVSDSLVHMATDTLLCTDTHKCYAMRSGVRQIYLVTSLKVPTYALRSLAQKTLQAIVKDKSVLL